MRPIPIKLCRPKCMLISFVLQAIFLIMKHSSKSHFSYRLKPEENSQFPQQRYAIFMKHDVNIFEFP